MKIIRLALSLLAVLTLSTLPLVAQATEGAPTPISVAAISDWLNKLETAKARITQINPDGTISTGKLYIRRPGRMRFEYDPPNAALVIAGGGSVAIFDYKSNEPPQQYPLKRTPLSVILAKDVDLTRDKMITGQSFDGTATTIRAQDPKNPEIGYIDLVFTDNPIELRQWVITDQDGNKTTVILGDLKTGIPLADSLFSVELELQKNAPDR
ncbi:MAG: outer membrane lipoprotein carrier protein LolA [Paracoccaceae bacterium]|nr:outer membrane lipoprotein carrier protein LolA [Paracoccaceae bacterium]